MGARLVFSVQLLSALLLQAPAEVRSLTVSVTDAKGAVEGLEVQDVAVLENGVARSIVRFEPDTRPLTVALLLDSSQALGSTFRLHLLTPVLTFLRGLPAGSQFAVWTTGDRPVKVVDFGTDFAEAENKLKRVFPQGGNTLLDALAEAAKDLAKKEGERSVVVAVTGLNGDFSHRNEYSAVDEARPNASLFMAVEFESGADLESRRRYDHALGALTKTSGGLLEHTLSPMSVEVPLQKVRADLTSRYRLDYSTLPDLKTRKIEITVAREGAKVRVSAPRKATE